ncbi:MAG: hypothetical protein KAT28_05035 [Candidatus Aenigmarchaeota archaeon]|nr:hypothetical protein [Candidatus Aenigmarchaeota archaeon]
MAEIIAGDYANYPSEEEKYLRDKKRINYKVLNDAGAVGISLGSFWLGSVINKYNEVVGDTGNIYTDSLMGVMPTVWYIIGVGGAVAAIYDFRRNIKRYKQLEMPENI